MHNLTSPAILKQLCKECGLIPSKKYGQNFLISEAPMLKMIEATGVEKGDTVVEIGPGFGVLTFALAERGARVIAFEIERRLEKYWEAYTNGNIQIVWGDVLNKISVISDQLSLPRDHRSPFTDHRSPITVHRSYKVIANLPYQITSHVLRTLLELENKPESITVMVQKEVAERIVAKPGDMSLLALSVQYYGEPRIVCKVPKGNFWPMPEVDSAVITIALKHKSTQTEEQSSTIKEFDKRFFGIARVGFANKRKQLSKNLAESLKRNKNDVETLLKDITGNEKVRAQELSVEQWITLVKKLI